MKTWIIPIILSNILILSFVFMPISKVYAPCMTDEDWPDAPCYADPDHHPTKEELRKAWSGYYQFKGKEWMESKKVEMDLAIKNGTLRAWVYPENESGTSPNSNVWYYYYLNGQAPYYIYGKYVNEVLPPRFQEKIGVSPPINIECNKELELIFKKTTGSPTCVKISSASRLVELGWGVSLKTIKVENTDVSMRYDIKGGKVLSIAAYGEPPTNNQGGVAGGSSTLIISIETVSKGQLEIAMPREIIDSKINGYDDGFFVLINKTEAQHDEISDSKTRTLIIPFVSGTDKIEVLGHGYYKEGLLMPPASGISYSPKLILAKSMSSSYEEFAHILVNATHDKIIKKRIDDEQRVVYTTDKGNLIIVKDTQPYSGLVDYFMTGANNKLVFTKDVGFGLNKTKFIESANSFMKNIGFTLDGTEHVEVADFGNRVGITIQQTNSGWIIQNQRMEFSFWQDQTEISLGRWYNDIGEYKFKLSQDDAEKIAKEYMDIEVKNNPNLQKYEYEFESISDGVRVIIFDDKLLYAVPISYKASAKMNYENGHCGGPEFLSVYVMVEGQKGAVLGWDYSPCM